MPNVSYKEWLSIGIIQTTLNNSLAWPPTSDCPSISPREDEKAWHEICKGIRALHDDSNKPQLLVLPELSLPRTRMEEFDRLVASINALTVVGVDYRLDRLMQTVRNEG
jgi:hypothetical protein